MKNIAFFLDNMYCEDQDTVILYIVLSFIFNVVVTCSYYIERQKEKEERLQHQIHLLRCDIKRMIQNANSSTDYNYVFF